ncbi:MULTISPECIES: IclR family transcriptional regulator [unclassified Microbacterium]|uniref:IclR family transcriptional regulator n=1 Tax=unclassified Microbacterium TaxID=2609290 RepID=UPI001604CED2|nr:MULTISPECIES: IclR family transcriptional regulator [unclassified Microbacterium]QNA93777.1 IclR family transcriptional regulator [Microbacterium sp. Se63.02b]QYM64072.1 IclR family transcriptional regulator [Microbacterium sp. Se5.02b]
MSDANYSIRSVQRVCDILDLVQATSDGLSLMDFAEATELPKSSVFRYLSTLEQRGYVERDDSGDYRMGISLNGDRLETLSRRLRPQLVAMRDRFGETINLGLLDGSRVAYLEIVESRASIRNAPRAAEREFIHATALGKVLATRMTTAQVRAILHQEGMPALTEHTIVDQAEYLAEVERTRERGYALDDEENEVGGRCLAVLVPRTTLPVAVSLSAPTSRLSVAETAAVARGMSEMIGAAAAFADSDLGAASEVPA